MSLINAIRGIKQNIEVLSLHITTNLVEDFVTYKFLIGQMRGLEAALAILEKNIGEENV